MNNSDELRDSWSSLGVAFQQEGKKIYNPEEAIIFLIQSRDFPEDKKMMSLAITWLAQYSRFVHVERLQKLMLKFSDQETAVLGAIASKCIGFNDHRWKKIKQLAFKKVKSRSKPFLSDEEFLITSKGLDPDFASFGIRIAPIDFEKNKKILSKDKIFSLNPWLKLRLLFGTNLRADVAAVLTLKLATTAYGAAKYLNSSMSAVYRNWQDLKEVDWDMISSKIS